MKPCFFRAIFCMLVSCMFLAKANANDSLVSFKTSKISFEEIAVAHKAILGVSKTGRLIEAFYFPGRTNKKALVLAGVHGSELSGIEVARELIKDLQYDTAHEYSTLVIPCLFVDNALMAVNDPSQIGGTKNIGRYTSAGMVDPNRQMPSPGKAYDASHGTDHLHRAIEKENALLLQLIGEFKPQRIVSIHAIRDTSRAGIYADPRTDAKGYAVGFEADSTLAIRMADYIVSAGGNVPGNLINSQPNAKYPSDPAIARAGQKQPRAECGSLLPGKIGCGISLGTWATTEVKDNEDPANNRDAIMLITMEFPGSKRTLDYGNAVDAQACKKNIKAYAASIRNVFLSH